MLIFTHPTGNPNVRADLASLERAGLLARFYTTLAWQPGSRGEALLPGRVVRELRRRAYPDVAPAHVAQMPLRELTRQAALQLGIGALTRHETGWASIDRVYQALDRRVAQAILRGDVAARGVYAYEDGALASFAAAGARGMRRIYELPIGYWRAGQQILGEERERRPEWAATLDAFDDSPAKLERKDAELAAADHIIVASDFVRATLGDRLPPATPIDVIPYGAPAPRGTPRPPRPDGPLRLLYVGQLRQRKGIAYLFDALRRLDGAATLTLVGSLPSVDCPALASELTRHRWLGTMPHAEVMAVMAAHDLLVFPSLFEGFGLVILEAMAQGLPVIATPHTAGPMVIEDGGDGFIVPIRDADAIATRVATLAADRGRLAAMSEAALRKAAFLSWERRAERFVAVIRGALGQQ